MVASIVMPDDLKKLGDVVTAYVDHWLALVEKGLDGDVLDSVAWQNIPERDRRNRAAMFSPQTNPVWGLVDRLVGAESGARMKALLNEQT